MEGSGGMFFGSYEHNLDAKGRLFIPSKFRSKIEGSVYITKGFDGCLSIYTKKDFEPKLKEYMSYSYNNKDTRSHLRIHFSSFDEIEIDKQGRLQIPSKFLKKEGISQEVIIVGVLDHFEIWDRKRWNEYYDENYDRDEEIAESLERKRVEE